MTGQMTPGRVYRPQQTLDGRLRNRALFKIIQGRSRLFKLVQGKKITLFGFQSAFKDPLLTSLIFASFRALKRPSTLDVFRFPAISISAFPKPQLSTGHD